MRRWDAAVDRGRRHRRTGWHGDTRRAASDEVEQGAERRGPVDEGRHRLHAGSLVGLWSPRPGGAQARGSRSSARHGKRWKHVKLGGLAGWRAISTENRRSRVPRGTLCLKQTECREARGLAFRVDRRRLCRGDEAPPDLRRLSRTRVGQGRRANQPTPPAIPPTMQGAVGGPG